MKNQEGFIHQSEITSLFLSGLLSVSEPEDILDFALHFFLRLDLPYSENTSSIFLYDPENRILTLTAHRGGPATLMACRGSVRPGECVCGRAAFDQKAVFVANVTDDRLHKITPKTAKDHGDLSVPIMARGGKLVGVWHSLLEPGAAVSPDVMESLSRMCFFLGTVLDRALTRKATASWNEDLRNSLKRCEEKLSLTELSLAQARDAKTDFLVSMNHELRTPLNPIIGFSQVLLGEYFGPLNAKQKEHVNDILESGKRLLALIDEILDLSRADMGIDTLDASPVSVGGLLSSMFLMIREKAFKHGISLETSIDDSVKCLDIFADEKKLKTAILNLLQNAVKFTPDGGRVTLGARLAEDGDRHSPSEGRDPKAGLSSCRLEIFVEDTGQGVAKQDQERIFEDFYQVRRGLSGKTPGAGLGLALARRFVLLHQGRLWVESEGVGKGSRFIVALPLGAG